MTELLSTKKGILRLLPEEKEVCEVYRPNEMSDTAFKSMVLRNNMTPKAINALAGSLERGKQLIVNNHG